MNSTTSIGANLNKEQEIDVVSIIAFENHLQNCIDFVKKASNHHKLFWKELLKEKPKLAVMNNIGSKINFSTN